MAFCKLKAGLHDAIAGLDVVKQEIAVGVNDFVAQSFGDGEQAAIDDRSGCGRDDGPYVAGAAAEPFEKDLPGLRRGSLCQGRIPRRHFGSANELREMIDVRQAQIVRNVLRILRALANRGGVFRAQAVGDAHFIDVGIGNKRQQAAVLVLPAETADAGLAGSFEDGHLNGFTVNPAIAEVRLILRESLERGVVNGFHETVPQGIECRAQCANVF